ncbi:SusD/RagB family nutrient-binding outer membrane lipoprotein [Flavitalea sp.]|nr:SusD/RagB family nutrient-binding outer membrane lipoprotein [Flavitalea sp.]
MKKIKIYMLGMITAMCMLSGCDKDFDELNVNTVDPTTLDPQFIMNRAIIESTYPDNFATLQMLTYNFGIVQQIITPFGSSLSGGNYNIFNPGNTTPVWINFYRNVLKQNFDVIEKTKENNALTNLYNQARIWKAYAFMILTDTYGDIPYTEAAQGFISGIIQPKYDKQETIYKDILKEIDEATVALDAAKPTSTGDILYGGDIIKWKRFGNSLLLRAAMRLSKVAPDIAKTYVAKAVAGGLMLSNNDDAILRHTGLYNNWIAVHLTAREKANFYLAKPFVDFLKSKNDPRLVSISVRHVGAKSGADQAPPRTTSDPALQLGMPMGYDDVSIKNTFPTYGTASLYDYSQVNLNTILKVTAQEYHVTFSQTQLLLAEAVVRGWTTGDANLLFQSGIRSHMRQMGDYDASAAISETNIQTYITANPLNMATALEQINTQYWVSAFMNGPELFANFRRSGFPTLTKNPYPGSEITGDFIRRMPYPDSEIITNSTNLNAAIAQQGKNDLNTRVWWDK